MIILKSFGNFIIYKLSPQREYFSLFLTLYVFSRKRISYNPPSYRFFHPTLSLQKNGLKCTIARSKLFKYIYIGRKESTMDSPHFLRYDSLRNFSQPIFQENVINYLLFYCSLISISITADIKSQLLFLKIN